MEPIIIQSLGFKAQAALEDFIKEKLQTIKHDKVVKTEVTLYLGPDSKPDNKTCEIRLHIPGNDLFAKKDGEYFEPAVSECIEVLKREVRELKERQADRRQADAEVIQNALMEGGADDDEL
ncbi:HPF/RaiA family ribosome-associated protein [Chitinophaga horti]|uniref:HPF/RaiA family ribosome-associated protein n=1 Tax=Chitinophaga horti TaxID=2920382 RepID=A0ABY6J703_9BACT|nr:HPF/RaiA family ribosome-associated protein [Chitinophaga horti]UYQ94079.1 HPF/RaiA family ribosome-associated protein [Chitinophaga horti]